MKSDGVITIENNKTIWIQSGAEAYDGLYMKFNSIDSNILGIDDIDVTFQEGADSAIDKTNYALKILAETRSLIGAQQNRLEHTIKNEMNVVENTQAAESLIRDTDMAREMVKYSNSNILAQAGQSMLARANQSNQGVLALLR